LADIAYVEYFDQGDVMRLKSHKGTTITEYTIIAVVVLLVTVGAWTQIANGFTDKMGKTRDDFKSRIASAQKQAAADAAAAAAAAAAAKASAALPPAPGGSGGSSAAVGPVSVTGVSSIIQTAGANGATDSLASSMEALATQLLAAGKITQAQANLIEQLAQAGHTMASGEAALQNAVSSGASTVTFNGQTYSVADFQAQFGFDNSVGNVAGASAMNSSAAMAQLQPFMSLYDQVQASGALSDPTTAAVVTGISQQIASLSDLAKWNTTTSDLDLSYAYVTQMTSIGATNVPTTISGATNSGSTVICGAGGGADSGTSCSP
jgi:Flp pilus assembly pilin Flp